MSVILDTETINITIPAPNRKESQTVTLCSLCSNSSTSVVPIYPAPPVTKMSYLVFRLIQKKGSISITNLTYDKLSNRFNQHRSSLISFPDSLMQSFFLVLRALSRKNQACSVYYNFLHYVYCKKQFAYLLRLVYITWILVHVQAILTLLHIVTHAN